MRRTKLILNVCTIMYNASFSGGRGGGGIKIAFWSDSVDWLDASQVKRLKILRRSELNLGRPKLEFGLCF